jgi:hypothetical protein
MAEYREYISALRKCAKEHEKDKLYTGQINTSDLCNDTAKLLEKLEIEIDKAIDEIKQDMIAHSGTGEQVIQAYCDGLKKALKYLENIGE